MVEGNSYLAVAEKIADWMDFWDANRLQVEVSFLWRLNSSDNNNSNNNNNLFSIPIYIHDIT